MVNVKNLKNLNIKKFVCFYEGISSIYEWILFFQKFYWKFCTKESIKRFIFLNRVVNAYPEIENIITFGSLSFGLSTPLSDFEILIIYKSKMEEKIERKIRNLIKINFNCNVDFCGHFFVYRYFLDVLKGKEEGVGFLSWFYGEYYLGLPVFHFSNLLKKIVRFVNERIDAKFVFKNVEKEIYEKRALFFERGFEKYNDRLKKEEKEIMERILKLQKIFFDSRSLEELDEYRKKYLKSFLAKNFNFVTIKKIELNNEVINFKNKF